MNKWIPFEKSWFDNVSSNNIYWVLTTRGQVFLCTWHEHQYFYRCAANYTHYNGQWEADDLNLPPYREPLTDVIAYQPFVCEPPEPADFEIVLKEQE